MIFDENTKAIYLQIADRICDGIIDGTFSEGDRLPSVREFAADAEVNANTVMRSYERLAGQGLIYNKRGIGFFVSPGARLKIIRERGEELTGTQLQSMFRLLMHLGVTPDMLRDEYQKFINENKAENINGK